MKNLSYIIAFLLVTTAACAQGTDGQQQKKIHVKGKAEKEIVPDEIYLRITLKEYKSSGSKRVTINSLEAALVKVVKQLGLSQSALTVDNIYGYNWNWKKRKAEEFLASKSFKLKVSDLKMVNELVGKLDAEGLNSMSVAEVSHSKIEEYKMQLKVEALKNAKKKAATLLSSIGEELGKALEITETNYGNSGPVYARHKRMMLSEATMDGGYQSDLEFKNITISSEISAVFEIK